MSRTIRTEPDADASQGHRSVSTPACPLLSPRTAAACWRRCYLDPLGSQRRRLSTCKRERSFYDLSERNPETRHSQAERVLEVQPSARHRRVAPDARVRHLRPLSPLGRRHRPGRPFRRPIQLRSTVEHRRPRLGPNETVASNQHRRCGAREDGRVEIRRRR